uniref:FAD-dependent monooxygenase hkm7 n=1 Tax=Aspergillus hancockii TaxID=1873369 RepID=HKM7_ASPHA|nr:RecName: Full=FAD-dependent monooxygenase hkm7; AltName: Full=Hancockiamides biosynthesis cluster protein 7 [Aspergillus hancockii]
MEIFESFGIEGEVTKQWEPATDEILWCRNESGTLSRMERFRNEPPVGVKWTHGTLQQGRVEEIMKKRITEISGVEVEYSTELSDLTINTRESSNSKASACSVTIRSVADDQEAHRSSETIRARYIIGADGGRSSIRDLMGVAMEGTKGTAIWGVMDILGGSDFPDFGATSVVRSDSDGAVDFVRREEGLTRIYVELNKCAAGWEALERDTITPELILEKCRYIIRPYKLEVDYVEWWSSFTVWQRLSKSMIVHDRVFLVGDAVHTHSPLCGMGMNTGIQDSFNLGWKLAGVVQGQLNYDILQTYETERRPVAEALLDTDRTVLDLFHAPLGPEAEALLAKVPALQVYLGGRGICYHESVLTCRLAQTLGDLTAGECLPDVTVFDYATGRPSSTHSWIKGNGGWAIIVWAGDVSRPSQMNLVQSLSRDMIELRDSLGKSGSMIDFFLIHCSAWPSVELADFPPLFFPTTKTIGRPNGRIFVDEKAVYDGLHISRAEGGVAIVRPDKHIAWAGGLQEVDSLQRYLRQVFRPQPE